MKKTKFFFFFFLFFFCLFLFSFKKNYYSLVSWISWKRWTTSSLSTRSDSQCFGSMHGSTCEAHRSTEHHRQHGSTIDFACRTHFSACRCFAARTIDGACNARSRRFARRNCRSAHRCVCQSRRHTTSQENAINNCKCIGNFEFWFDLVWSWFWY